MLCSQDNMPATQRMNMMQSILPCLIFNALIPQKPQEGTSTAVDHDWHDFTTICTFVLTLFDFEFDAYKCKTTCSFSSRCFVRSIKHKKTDPGPILHAGRAKNCSKGSHSIGLCSSQQHQTASQVVFCYCISLYYLTVTAIAFSNSLSASC